MSSSLSAGGAAALGSAPVAGLLLRYSLPAIAGMIAVSLYNIVDSIFIGRWVGPEALTALGVAFPLMNVAFAFGMLLGVGGAAVCSIRMGAGDMDGARRVLRSGGPQCACRRCLLLRGYGGAGPGAAAFWRQCTDS